MRNRHLIEQFMRENDIEYDVPFKIVIKPPIGETDFDTVYIHKDDNMYIGFTLNYADTDEVVEGDRFDIIDLLFADNVKIVKKPWKPKKNEKYYFINVHNNIDYDWFDNAFVCDRYRYITGNFFKTYNEAEKHKDKMLKILKGEPLVKWED